MLIDSKIKYFGAKTNDHNLGVYILRRCLQEDGRLRLKKKEKKEKNTKCLQVSL